MTEDYSIVVPAKAGTHKHRSEFGAQLKATDTVFTKKLHGV